MASYGLWWFEIVVALLGLMAAGFVAGETTAFLSVRRMRLRDGGVPAPRTKAEYRLIFPRACPRCLSRRGRQVRGWHLDQYGTREYIAAWQCGDCAYFEGGRPLSPAPGADIAQESVRARPRWFISKAEAERIAPPTA